MDTCLEDHRIFSSIPSLNPLDANSMPAASFDDQYLQRESNIPWVQNCPLVENHGSEIFCELSSKSSRKLCIMIAGNPTHLIQDPSLDKIFFFFFYTKSQFPHLHDTEVIVRPSGPPCLHLFHLMLQFGGITGVFHWDRCRVSLSSRTTHLPGIPPPPEAQIGSPSFRLSF